MDNAYDEILKRAETELSAEEQTKLSQQLLRHVASKNNGQQHRITDLKGLGKEIWKDVDVDEYIAKERDSWDG